MSPFPLLQCEFLRIGDYVLLIFVSLVPMLGWCRCQRVIENMMELN